MYMVLIVEKGFVVVFWELVEEGDNLYMWLYCQLLLLMEFGSKDVVEIEKEINW